MVADYMFDPAHEAAWTTGVVESRPLTPGRLRRGSRVQRVSQFLGRRFGYVYEVIDADDDAFVEIKVQKPFAMHIRYELSDIPDGTLARIRVKGEPKGFFKIAAGLMSGKVRANVSADLALLKNQLEKDGEPGAFVR